jgi:hypothetical protein
MFMRFETTRVPIDRVLTNMTNRLASNTNKLETLQIIARLHAMSYACAASNWVVDTYDASERSRRGPAANQVQKDQIPFFGFGPDTPPKTIAAPSTPQQKEAAAKHLKSAIDFYKRALAVDPTNEVILLGLGWCQTQSGDTNTARQTLRNAVDLAWDKDNAHPGMFYVTDEAIRYLRPLLDPTKDKQELESLRRIYEQTTSLNRPVTPLVVPLAANLPISSLINTNASIAFDLDGSAVPGRRWQWITTNAAWIVHLPQGGSVTSALQMFGNVTFWVFWKNGYHALASLDDNGDGILGGNELRGIALWQDRNSDGICSPDEILTLQQLGIIALDTRYTETNSIPTSPTGAHLSTGETLPTYDIILNRVR